MKRSYKCHWCENRVEHDPSLRVVIVACATCWDLQYQGALRELERTHWSLTRWALVLFVAGLLLGYLLHMAVIP